MKKVFITILTVFLALNTYSQDSVRIYGYATNFNNQKLNGVTIRLKNDKFENLYETVTDSSGFYSITVAKGMYNCLYAIKLPDYGKTKLEYWAWTIPAYTDLEINPQYDRMELYGVNAFEVQVTPWETYMVYFRPMSLTKSLELQNGVDKKQVELVDKIKVDTINIAPDSICVDELQIFINDMPTDIVGITKTAEYARGMYLYGYFVQVKKHKKTPVSPFGYDKISIILKSKETNECGRSDCFVRR